MGERRLMVGGIGRDRSTPTPRPLAGQGALRRKVIYSPLNSIIINSGELGKRRGKMGRQTRGGGGESGERGVGWNY